VDGKPARGTYALLIHQPSARPPRSTRVQRDVTPSAEGRVQSTLELPDWIDPRLPVEVMLSVVDPPVIREFMDELWLDPLEGRRAIHLGTPAPTDQDSVFELTELTLELQPAPVQWELTIGAPSEEIVRFEYRPQRDGNPEHARALELPTNRPIQVFGWGDHFNWLVHGQSEAGLAIPETTLGLAPQVHLTTTEHVTLTAQVQFQLWEESAIVVLRPYASPPALESPYGASINGMLFLKHVEHHMARGASASQPKVSFANVPTGRYMLEFWSPEDRSRGYPSRTVGFDTGDGLAVDL
jgi:hypothetical protein